MVRAVSGACADSALSAIRLGMGARSMASGRSPSKLMMMARLMSALEGSGVELGVKVARGVEVSVMVAVGEAVWVAAGVSVMLGVSAAVT